MPTLEFKGKPFVYSHHLSVPLRELIPVPDKSVPGGKKASLDDNLIIHGDNLEALKALLPRYAGKVDVIYIDPPYNTGNEGWAYNDAVNSPLMKEWLGKVVDRDDLERHDKWLCMMWPRLQLMKELLAATGFIAISCDNNEAANLRSVTDEVFGEENFINAVAIQANPRGRQSDTYVATVHDFLLLYACDIEECAFRGVEASEDYELEFNHIDESGERWRELGLRQRGAESLRQDREDMFFPIFVNPNDGAVSLVEKAPFTVCVEPTKSDGREGRWSWSSSTVRDRKNLVYGRVVRGQRGERYDIFYRDYFKRQGKERRQKPKSIWSGQSVNTERGGLELKEIMGSEIFEYPKPVQLITRVIDFCPKPDALVLDSFAGSGVTGKPS